MQLKKKLALLALLCLSLALLAACGSKTTNENSDASTSDEPEASQTEDETPTEEGSTLTGKHHVTIDVQDYGTITVELDADAAPITVENFLNLAESGFYDGLTFHRIAANFVLQGGDPNGNGTGGSENTITGEFAANGIENNLSHTRGAISMARSNAYDSASSQFFIVLEDADFLDGNYAAFGYVTEGMEIVDKICEETPVADMDTGLVNAENQPIITRVTVID
jgi:peptidyl-prolyl cis-trans isomerase B (cyclophilin B)